MSQRRGPRASVAPAPRRNPGGSAAARLRVLFLINEAEPLVKVGGLADVGGSLPAALREMGLDVRLALPLHPTLRPLIEGERPSAVLSGLDPRSCVRRYSAYA